MRTLTRAHTQTRRLVRQSVAVGVGVLIVSAGAIADEPVAFTSFYPHQVLQRAALSSNQPSPAPWTTLPGTAIATRTTSRLLIVWTLDLISSPGAQPIEAQVTVGGIPGPIAHVLIPLNEARSITGSHIVTPAVPAGTDINLRWRRTNGAPGNVTALAASTTISVIELP